MIESATPLLVKTPNFRSSEKGLRMKTKLLLLLVLCVSSWARAQTNITAQGSDCTTTNACATINLPASAGAVGVTIDGTFTATLQFEVSADRGKTWVSAQGTPLDGTTGVTSVNAAGVWRFAVSGLTGIRVRCSAYVSGTVIVNLQQSPTAASLGGGGSSTPAFSSITAGTNTTAAMLVGTGASLGPTGSGTITATTGAFTGATQFFFPVFGASGAIGNSLCSTNAGLTVLTCTYTGGLSIGGSGSGTVTLSGSTSGSAAIQVAAVAGTPNPLQLPTATAGANQVLKSDGGNPQVLSWVANGGSTALSGLTAAGGPNTLANGNNPQTWNWAQTTDSQDGIAFGETSAATSGTLTSGLANQANVSISTASASTATPLEVAQGSITGTIAFPALQVETTWNNAGLTGEGIIENVTDTSSASGSLLLDLRKGNTSQLTVNKTGAVAANGSVTSGVASTTQGNVIIQGGTSGSLTVTTQGTAGTPTWTAGTSSGTPAVTASAPLVLTTATGNIACATCATTSGGGSLTLDQVGAAAAAWSPANADQPLTLNFASTTSGRVSFKIGETSASTSAGTPYLAQIVAASGSTAVPLDLQQTETGSQALSMLKLEPTLNTSGSPDIVAINATETSDGASTNFLHFKGGASAATDEFIVSKAGTISANGTYGATATSSIVTLRGAAAHVESTATAIPTVTAGCGTSPVVQTGATDNWFRLNVGTGGTATTCTVTFQKAFTQIPACVVNDESAIVTTQAVPTTTTVVLNIAVAWAASSILDVHCGI